MKNSITFLLVLSSFASFAQPLRLHIMGGFANYSGDLQPKRFTLNQAHGVVSAGATYNLTEQFALRADYSFGRVSASDKYSINADRNLDFITNIAEFTLLGEYDFLNTHDRRLTPYAFAGIGGFYFSPYTLNELGNKVHLNILRTEGQETSEHPERKVYKRIQLNIPVGGGMKYALSDDIHLSLELGFRKLFTDYLDDVSTTYASESVLLNEVGPGSGQFSYRGDEVLHSPRPYPQSGAQRGSPKYKDYYYFGQLRISFRMNWFGGDAFEGRRSRMGCPTRI